MRIVVAGGTGFLGNALIGALQRDGHRVAVLTRRATSASGRTAAPAQPELVAWRPDGTVGPWAAALDGADVVINLAGEPIAGGRWTADRKRRIASSRIESTRSLATAIAAATAPPALFISASGVGYYGPCGDEVVTESHDAGSDFLAGVCIEWEGEARRAASAHTRVVCLRTGLVLDRDGGALPQLLLPFRLGAGGRLGSGHQYWPWIHRQDWVDLVRHLLTAPSASGPVNVSAPTPVTNAEFTRALGRVLHRPALLPAPAFALRLALGEMADALLLSGQRAVPAAAEQLGYRFTHTDLEPALRDLLV